MKKIVISQSITNPESVSINYYLKDISKYPLLSADEETALIQSYHNGSQEAFNKLVNCNLRFVVSIAKKYQGYGLSLEDLINEGNIGLIKAIDSFDETLGFKLITYAVWWIRQTIMLAINNEAKVIKEPISHINEVLKIKQTMAKLEQLYCRTPTIEEVSEELEMPVTKVKMILSTSNQTISLDAPVSSDEESTTLIDTIKDDTASSDNSLMQESLKKDIEDALSILNDKERNILKMRFGINRPTSISLEEIATEYNLSRERVSQVVKKSIAKIRRSSKSNALLAYM